MSRTTGWPPGLLQDDSRELSTWLASRPGARRLVDERCAEIRAEAAKSGRPADASKGRAKAKLTAAAAWPTK